MKRSASQILVLQGALPTTVWLSLAPQMTSIVLQVNALANLTKTTTLTKESIVFQVNALANLTKTTLPKQLVTHCLLPI